MLGRPSNARVVRAMYLPVVSETGRETFRPATRATATWLYRDGLKLVALAWGLDVPQAAALIGERMGVPAAQLRAWLRARPLACAAYELFSDTVDRLRHEGMDRKEGAAMAEVTKSDAERERREARRRMEKMAGLEAGHLDRLEQEESDHRSEEVRDRLSKNMAGVLTDRQARIAKMVGVKPEELLTNIRESEAAR